MKYCLNMDQFLPIFKFQVNFFAHFPEHYCLNIENNLIALFIFDLIILRFQKDNRHL